MGTTIALAECGWLEGQRPRGDRVRVTIALERLLAMPGPRVIAVAVLGRRTHGVDQRTTLRGRTTLPWQACRHERARERSVGTPGRRRRRVRS